VYSSQSPDEVRDRYEAWASDYDSDLTDTYDYSLPKATVEDFWRWVPRTANVLDAGAGTGLVAINWDGSGIQTSWESISRPPCWLERRIWGYMRNCTK
jgi:predicted TPR repeat methyltransferase